MNNRIESYARRQRLFWNVEDRDAARFERVDTVSPRSEDAWEALAERDIDRVLEGIDVRDTWTVVEVGCGVGRLISRLRHRNHNVRIIGVDIAEKMIAYARETLAGDPSVELHVNSGYDLAIIPEGTADFVYANDVFIHIFDIDVARQYFEEVLRILKPLGTFRFNVRYFDPTRSFANTLGGMYARFVYSIGLRSTLNRWAENQNAEFNGIQYRQRDLHTLVAGTGLDVLSIKVLNGCLWCSCQRPGRCS